MKWISTRYTFISFIHIGLCLKSIAIANLLLLYSDKDTRNLEKNFFIFRHIIIKPFLFGFILLLQSLDLLLYVGCISIWTSAY